MSIVLRELPAPLPRAEELANCVTHALGFALSLVGTGVLLHVASQSGDTVKMIGVAVYGATLMALYGASTLSHTFERPRARHFFRTVDQVCIFLLIAGTFTPIALAYLRDGWWWALFAAVWGLAIVGCFIKIFFARLNNVATGAYVLLGWLPVIAVKPIVALMPPVTLAWIVGGGVLYTLGTFFLQRDEQVPYYHAVWHVFVIAASVCHYVAVMQLIMPTG